MQHPSDLPDLCGFLLPVPLPCLIHFDCKPLEQSLSFVQLLAQWKCLHFSLVISKALLKDTHHICCWNSCSLSLALANVVSRSKHQDFKLSSVCLAGPWKAHSLQPEQRFWEASSEPTLIASSSSLLLSLLPWGRDLPKARQREVYSLLSSSDHAGKGGRSSTCSQESQEKPVPYASRLPEICLCLLQDVNLRDL